MALGTALVVNQHDVTFRIREKIVYPTSITTDWVSLIDAGGLDGADNAGNPITDPDTQIVQTAEHYTKFTDQATTLLVRMAYSTTTTALVTPPIINIFGRMMYENSSTVGTWMKLANLIGENSITITPDFTNDHEDANFAYTLVSLSADGPNPGIDLLGCNQILVGVEVAVAGNTGGTLANYVLQGKVI